MEFSFVLATQSNCKSGEDVSQIIEPEWFVEKSAVKTDIYLEKDHGLVCVGKYPICIKCPPFLTFVLYPLQSTFVIAEQSDWSRKISLPITRQITQEDINLLLQKNNCCQVFSRSRNDQPLFVNEYEFKVGWQLSSLKNGCLENRPLRPPKIPTRTTLNFID